MYRYTNHTRERIQRMTGSIVRQHCSVPSPTEWSQRPAAEFGPPPQIPVWKSPIDDTVKRFTTLVATVSHSLLLPTASPPTTFQSAVYNDTLRLHVRHANLNGWATFQIGGVMFETAMFMYGSTTQPRGTSNVAFVLTESMSETKESYHACMLLLSDQYFLVATLLYIIANGDHARFYQFLDIMAWGDPQEKAVFVELFYRHGRVYLTAFGQMAHGDRSRVLDFIGVFFKEKHGNVYPVVLECIVCKELLLEERPRYFMQHDGPIRVDREETLSTNTLHQEGISAFTRQDYNTALWKINQILQVKRKEGLVLVFNAQVLFTVNRIQEAHESLSAAENVATRLQSSGKHKQACDIWDALLSLNPRSTVAQNGKRACCEQLQTPTRKRCRSETSGSQQVATAPIPKISKRDERAAANINKEGNLSIITKHSPDDNDGSCPKMSAPKTQKSDVVQSAGLKAPPSASSLGKREELSKKSASKGNQPTIPKKDSSQDDNGAAASCPKILHLGGTPNTKQEVIVIQDSFDDDESPAISRGKMSQKGASKGKHAATEVIEIQDSFDDEDSCPKELADTKPSAKSCPPAKTSQQSELVGSPAPETEKERHSRLKRERYAEQNARLQELGVKLARAPRQSLDGLSDADKMARQNNQNKIRKRVKKAIAKAGKESPLVKHLKSSPRPLSQAEVDLVHKELNAQIQKSHLTSSENVSKKHVTSSERVALAAMSQKSPSRTAGSSNELPDSDDDGHI